MRRPKTKTASFKEGTRVVPIDSRSLWSNAAVSLTVIECGPCKTPHFKGLETIVLEICWTGKTPFRAGQLSRDYREFVP